MTNDALTQIGHGLNNLHATVLASQHASEKRHASLDARMEERFNALYQRLDEVCDKGRSDHAEFRSGIFELDARMRVQEARAQGRADILKPAFEWLGKNWVGVLLAGYIAWTQVVQPTLAAMIRHGDANAGRLTISSPL